MFKHLFVCRLMRISSTRSPSIQLKHIRFLVFLFFFFCSFCVMLMRFSPVAIPEFFSKFCKWFFMHFTSAIAFWLYSNSWPLVIDCWTPVESTEQDYTSLKVALFSISYIVVVALLILTYICIFPPVIGISLPMDPIKLFVFTHFHIPMYICM